MEFFKDGRDTMSLIPELDDHVHNVVFSIPRRYINAGNNNVNGTDVNAPINATKSLKNGTAFATIYDDIAKVAVKINQSLLFLR